MTTCSSDGTLHTCNADGSDFTLTKKCDSPALCDQQNARCNDCMPGAKLCNSTGDGVVTCGSDGKMGAPMACTAVAGSCNTSICSAGVCVQGFMKAGSACSQSGGTMCNDKGKCVSCIDKSDCGQFQDCDATTNSCKDVPACGNGQYDPGEVCEVAAPNKYSPGTCDPSKCQLTELAYAGCSGSCIYNSDQGWLCGGPGVCTHVCGPDIPNQCKTTAGTGVCRTITNPQDNSTVGSFCVLACSGPNGTCPNGLHCRDFSAYNIGYVCSSN
jgi:hypothetical protein